MSEDLKEKLKTEIEQADWDMLAPHHEKGAVYLVSKKLDLLDVAVALAVDNPKQVKLWLDGGELTKPSDKQVEDYSKNSFEKICNFLIIQPFVLAQLLD